MKLILKIIFSVFVNVVALWAAAKYIPGFNLTSDWKQIVILAAILMILNFVLKPILKLVLGPIIVLTLGLGLIVVNALVLYVLDIYSLNLTIENIPALIFSTILIGVINFVFHIVL